MSSRLCQWPWCFLNKGLMYVEAYLKGKLTKGIVDMNTTHSFVFLEKTKILKLYVSKENGWLKIINFTTKALQGVAYGLTLWQIKDKIDFIVTPINDFKVVVKITRCSMWTNSMTHERPNWFHCGTNKWLQGSS